MALRYVMLHYAMRHVEKVQIIKGFMFQSRAWNLLVLGLWSWRWLPNEQLVSDGIQRTMELQG
jgi:hypothetical protein